MIEIRIKEGKIKTTIATKSDKLPGEVYDLFSRFLLSLQKELPNEQADTATFAAFCAVNEFIPTGEVETWAARAEKLHEHEEA